MWNRLANDWQNGSYPNMDGNKYTHHKNAHTHNLHSKNAASQRLHLASQRKINVHFKSRTFRIKQGKQQQKTRLLLQCFEVLRYNSNLISPQILCRSFLVNCYIFIGIFSSCCRGHFLHAQFFCALFSFSRISHTNCSALSVHCLWLIPRSVAKLFKCHAKHELRLDIMLCACRLL